MKENIKNYKFCKLTKKICIEKGEKILELLKTIPNSNYKLEDLFLEKKGERILYGKWEHSLVVLDDENVVGVLIGYEREKESEGVYIDNCFYVNEIAVSKKYKGQEIGKSLLEMFIQNVKKYNYLDGELKIRIQTTNSEDNKKVIELYKKVGFKERGIKKYPLKEDIILEIIK